MRHGFMGASPATAEEQESRPDFEVFQKIAENWGLNTDQQMVLLGGPARSTFFKWKKEGSYLPKDTEERISHIVSIYKSLQILLPDPKVADQWIKRPNKYWLNISALEKILSGRFSDLVEVRTYVDSQRGG